ncbi:SET domain-containing protein [Lindgomyces ingoldianus]|uniref:SET domain-containing protein n=1 Tax=Lindgomyces ingoldianus TaxID=673940 RepID=A0ACB6QQ82_9PLEO|nr:SET domain-containing protein [Lindgomyces ingoldianus]KAF2469154.1 SET domain-containing protein [Lindgomyces ingoldianus]
MAHFLRSFTSAPASCFIFLLRPDSIYPSLDLKMQTPKAPPGSPISTLFEIRQTPHCGRAVFATHDIPADTVVFCSDDLTLSVLLREYRREVCAQCFGYEHGRNLKISDPAVGFAFCSEGCQNKWREEVGEIGVQAWTAVENLVRKRGREDCEMVDVDLPRPKPKDITKAWEGVAAQAALIRVARHGDRISEEVTEETKVERPAQVTKQHRKALQRALLSPISPDVMSFCVSGLLWRYSKPGDWERVLTLIPDTTPYHNIADLQAFTRSYLHLLAVLPLPLLDFVTPETLFILSARDSHNSFGIRSLEDEGSEFFGYGCWPAASYFNHSCAPSLEKIRVGRMWEFRAGRDIEAGEELSITYLSGEERRLSRGKRMIILMNNWGFECGCERCEVIY